MDRDEPDGVEAVCEWLATEAGLCEEDFGAWPVHMLMPNEGAWDTVSSARPGKRTQSHKGGSFRSGSPEVHLKHMSAGASLLRGHKSGAGPASGGSGTLAV